VLPKKKSTKEKNRRGGEIAPLTETKPLAFCCPALRSLFPEPKAFSVGKEKSMREGKSEKGAGEPKEKKRYDRKARATLFL